MKKTFGYKRSFLPIINCLLLFAFCFPHLSSLAQTDTLKKHKIALFAPLYLDSAFDAGNEYRYAKNVFPGYINSGLEFYQGAQLALDTLTLENAPLEIFIYDTRSTKETLEQQLAKKELDDVELIIAHCSINEIRTFSNAALKKNIPFINTTIPNDAGIYANPFFVLLNPTLKTQCEGIYQFIKKTYTSAPVTIFRRKGNADNIIKQNFDEYSSVALTSPLRTKYVELNDSFTVEQLIVHLDSTKNNVCMSGSLDINFGRRLAQQLSSIGSQYPVSLIGMPTWDAIKDFHKPEFKSIEIVYSTPFHNPKKDRISETITEYFNTQMYARPSDMVFRGYEVTWKFAKLLMKYGKDISSNLSNKENVVFTEYDIQPVINRKTMTLDYFENRKLYFIRWMDGTYKVN